MWPNILGIGNLHKNTLGIQKMKDSFEYLSFLRKRSVVFWSKTWFSEKQLKMDMDEYYDFNKTENFKFYKHSKN